ncbi:MAG TPA: hypothetical protein VM223_05940, partial [Planctomycetota bacterium]|nr:hypothetical protein [Planctomycetota bacterium]
MNLTDVMSRLYDSEINCGISCFWDGGWDVWLGDDMNGHVADTEIEQEPDAFAMAAKWLDATARERYP